MDRRNRQIQKKLHSQVTMASKYGKTFDGDGVAMIASSYGFAICGECDHIHIWLVNDAGKQFATATFAVDEIDNLCEEIQSFKTQILKRRH